MAPKKSLLTAALLSSTLFALLPTLSYAIVDLDAAANFQDTNNGAYPPGTGYNFIAPNVTFTILDNIDPGNDGGVSLANNLFRPGSPFENTTINFIGNSDVDEDVGSLTNPIGLINVNTGFVTAPLLTFQGNLVVVDRIHLLDGSLGNPLDFTNVSFAPAGGTLDVHAPITTQTNLTGILSINGDTIFHERIGEPDRRLSSVNVNDNVEFQADVFSNILNTGANVITINDATIFGSIATTNAGEGDIVYEGTSDIVQPIGFGNPVNTVTFAPGARVDVNALISTANGVTIDDAIVKLLRTLVITGDVDVINGGILSIAHGASPIVNGTVTFQNGTDTRLQFDMNHDLTAPGLLTATDGFVFNDATIDILNPGFWPGTHIIAPIIQDGQGVPTLPPSIPVNTRSLLTSFQVLIDTNPSLMNLVITSLPSENFAHFSNTNGIAHALDLIAPIMLVPGSGALRDVLGQMSLFMDEFSLNQALASLAPIVDGAIIYETFYNQQTIFGDIGERMDTVRFWRNHMHNGMANGDADCSNQDSAWMKLIGHHAEQDERDNIAGYNNNMAGIVAGWDVTTNNASTIGGSLAWTYSRVDHKVWDGSKTDIHSFQGSAYFAYNCESPFFFDAMMGLAYNNYNQYREVQFGSIHLQPRADFDAWQLGLKGDIGYVLDSQFYNSHVVPHISLYYSHLMLSAYDESGAGTANQIYDSRDYDALILSAGVKFLQDWVDKAVLIQPELHFNVYYDFVGDTMETTTQFIGGVGPEFRTVGFEPPQLGVNAGAAVSIYTHRGVTWTAEYDFNVKADYFAHTGFLRARYVWG